MLIIDSEKNQKIINTWANENIFLKGHQWSTQSLF